jgi:hypothetical protein
LIIVSAKADLSFPNVSIGEACRNDIVLAETTTKAKYVIVVFSIVPIFNLVFGRGDGLSGTWLLGVFIYIRY